MKTFLAQKREQALKRETAWGCLTSNLAVPGIGSLLAGRIVGIAQFLLGMTGLGVSLICVIRLGFWLLQNWERLQDPAGDPVAALGEILLALRWPLLGIGLFAVAWIWGLGTGLSIVNAAKRAERANAPPGQSESR